MRKYLTRAVIGAFAFLTALAGANQLTPGGQTVTGSAVNQISSVQPAGQNLLFDVSSANYATWTLSGSAAISANAANQWDAGFIPVRLQGALTTSAMSKSVTLSQAQAVSYTFSTQVSVASALSGITNPSQNAKIELIYTGGSRGTDTVIFNPASGQIISAIPGISGGISAVQVQLFNTIVVNSTTGANSTVPVLGLSITSARVPAATTAVNVKIYPNANAASGTRQIILGAFQYELGAVGTAFMPNVNSSANSSAIPRKLGTIPRQSVDLNAPYIPFTSTGSFNTRSDTNTTAIFTAGGGTYTLADSGTSSPPKNGDTITVVNSNSGQTTIATSGTDKIFGPGIAAAGVTSFAFPSAGSNTYPGASITFTYDLPSLAWRVSGGNLSAVTQGAGGSGCVPAGSAGQLLTDDGAGGCTANTTGTGVVTAAGNAINTAGAIAVPPAALAANQLVLGGGSGTGPATLGSLGTTTTVLHGNAAGAPTFGAVALGTDVSGDLPYANLTPATGASVLLGRGSAGGAGDWQEITLGANLTMTNQVLAATGGAGSGCIPAGSASQALVDDGAGGCTATGRLSISAVSIAATPDSGTDFSVTLAGGGSVAVAGDASGALANITASGTGSELRIQNSAANIDAWTRYSNTNGTPLSWSVGLDASASKAFVISESTTLGTNNAISIAPTTRAVTLATPLGVASGGTGLSSGTSGGILAYTASGTLASSGALTANLPVIGGGAGVAPSVGTRSGNTTAFVTTTGTQTSGDCVKIDANGNHIANGSACGGAPGGSNTQVQFNNSSAFGGSANLTWVSPALTVGVAGSTTGQYKLTGSTSGTITMQGQAAAGTYNFNLPNTAGIAGQVLTSQAGGATAMTWSDFAPLSGSLTNTGVMYTDGSNVLSGAATTANSVLLGGASGPKTVAGFTTNGTATMILGQSGTSAGTLQFNNATSGAVSLTVPTGALGTVTATLPAANTFVPISSQVLTFAGPTAARTITFPDAAITVARTDAANTFTGTQTIGALVATTVNGNTVTTGTGTLTLGAGKTATVSNTLTFTGTDSSSVAFGAGGTVSYKVASGTSALGTSAISSATCATVVTTTATGTATTDVINWGFNGDPTGVTGYAASASGMLTIIAYPSANNVNFKVCNNTAGSITPGAITLNWIVVK